uniref:Chaperone Hsp40, co-chaperone with DnaK n=1 Tax=mine drainage metagenome TaxID=410659 RepID=E6Q5D4_9ZZZZ
MPSVDYYEVLGVARDAAPEAIKRAYRQLARQHHPDVASDKANAETRFKEINEAYEVLSNPEKRAHYDRFGSADPNEGFTGSPFGGGGFGDIFDMFFSEMRHGGQQRRSGPQRGSDLRYDLDISLEEAFAGTTRELTFTHLGQCETCSGSGAAEGSTVAPCIQCAGSGVVRVARQTPLGQFVTQNTCPRCGGDGQMVARPCESCGGRGRKESERKLTVKIPAGVDDGARIRIAGSGEGGIRGGAAGDLFVYLSVRRHERFRREGMDTAVDIPIAFTHAALGATLRVPSLEGELELTIPPGTQTGTTLRMRGHGMPSVRGGQRGDHHITVHVVTPTRVSKKQRELLEEFAKLGGDEIEERSFFERLKEAFRPE